MRNRANNKEHALRYLLLKVLARWKGQANTSTYLQVVNSLTISSEGKDPEWHIEWRSDGTNRVYDIPKSELRLFHRADKKGLPPRDLEESPSGHNEHVASEFAKVALGLQGVVREEMEHSPDKSFGLRLAGYICMALLVCVFELSLSGYVLALGLLLVIFSEHSRIGFYAWPVFCLGLLVAGLPFTSLIGAVGVLLLGYLDPFSRARVIHAFVNIFVLVLILGHLLSVGVVPVLSYSVIFGVGVSLILTSWRWLYGSHFGLLPLILPLLISGLFLDGHASTGSLIAACVAAGLVVVSGTLRILPYSLHNF